MVQPATLGSWVYTEQQDRCWYSQPPWGPGSTQSNRTAAGAASHPGVLGLHRATGQLLVQPASMGSSGHPGVLGLHRATGELMVQPATQRALGPPWGPGSTQSNRTAAGAASHPGVLGLHKATGRQLVTGG